MYRHAFDPLSAAFGVIFLLVGLPLLFSDVNLFAIRWSWAGPILAIILGGALLLSGLRRRDTSPEEGTSVPTGDDSATTDLGT